MKRKTEMTPVVSNSLMVLEKKPKISLNAANGGGTPASAETP
jgi:hypothetical protein